jgi:hypothetical protein
MGTPVPKKVQDKTRRGARLESMSVGVAPNTRIVRRPRKQLASRCRLKLMPNCSTGRKNAKTLQVIFCCQDLRDVSDRVQALLRLVLSW